MEESELEVQFTDEGLGPWSYSKLKTLQQCPLQFYLKYVLKLKVTRVIEGLPVAEIGSTAHKVLEHIVAGKSVADSFAAAKRDHFVKLGEAYWVEHVQSLELNMMEFKNKLEAFSEKTPIKRHIGELKIGINKNWEPTSFFADDVYFRGITDLVLQLENGDAIIIDHKTGGGTEYGGIKNHQVQLDIYKILIHFGVQKVTGAQSGIHFIKEGAILLGDYSPAAEIETRLRERLQFYIQSAIDTVKEIGYFKHKRGNACKYCEFDPKCKEGGYLAQEKATARLFKE